MKKFLLRLDKFEKDFNKNKIALISQNEKVYNFFYRIYWFILFNKYFLYDLKNIKVNKNRVFDQYGMIDTLGNNYEKGKYTYSYTSELTSFSGLYLPFNLSIEMYSDNNKVYLKLNSSEKTKNNK